MVYQRIQKSFLNLRSIFFISQTIIMSQISLLSVLKNSKLKYNKFDSKNISSQKYFIINSLMNDIIFN